MYKKGSKKEGEKTINIYTQKEEEQSTINVKKTFNCSICETSFEKEGKLKQGLLYFPLDYALNMRVTKRRPRI